MSYNPAKILSISGGSLKQGVPADIVIFDMEKEWVYSEDKIVSKSKNTPFLDKKLKGLVKYTLCDGEIVWEN